MEDDEVHDATHVRVGAQWQHSLGHTGVGLKGQRAQGTAGSIGDGRVIGMVVEW